MKRRIVHVIAVTALFVGAATPALAAKGGNSGSGSSSITLVTLGSTGNTLTAQASTSPRVGDSVTFDVQTSATDRPYILLNCYRTGEWIYASQSFYSATNPPLFTLSSSAWTSGGADCTARLGKLNADGTRFTELASTSFTVNG
jgi:hypothetical protein